VIREMGGEDGRRGIESIRPAGLPVKTLALIPLGVKGENPGLLQLMSEHPDYFAQEDVEFYEGLVQILGVALAYGLTQVALRERVKELTCLYGISRLAERPNPSLAAFLQGVADLLPPAWLYPEVASGRVRLDGQTYTTPGFREDTQRLAAEIVVAGRERGVVEVTYTEEKPEIDEGPFLKEERHLIDTIAREIALIIKRREAEEARARLEEQLRHADRLATIGQLAAGVAHELNEPLGSVLGFAQLAQKCPDLPKAAARDIERIVSAALHAREIIRKLRLFAREAPPETTRVNLNRIVDEGLFFFERRCANSGIELVRSLEPDLPEVVADASQLNQVLINLVVNAIQAIPRAGRITVKTLTDADQALLVVEDTGIGMSEEVQKQIFIPFFTTKDIDEGTGLGLPVVHGIVTSHGGSIRVHSEEGRGTRFEVRLPIAPERSRTEEDPNGDRD
jgi:two-component system NtrC family sensor kinase